MLKNKRSSGAWENLERQLHGKQGSGVLQLQLWVPSAMCLQIINHDFVHNQERSEFKFHSSFKKSGITGLLRNLENLENLEKSGNLIFD